MKWYTDQKLATLDLLAESVYAEHKRQIVKWGVQSHTLFEWLAYATEELGELSQAISEHVYRQGTAEDIFKEAIHLATLSLKIAEMIQKEVS